MSIIDQLFGPQPQDSQGLVQSILSQRFAPNPEDVGQATLQTATTGGRFINPSEIMQQRLQPAMGVAGTLGQLNMSQIAIQHMQDEQNRTNLMMLEAFGKLPDGGGMMGGGGASPAGFAAPSAAPNNAMPPIAPQQNNMPPVGFQNNPPNVDSNQGQRIPITTGFGMPIPAPSEPVLARDAQGNVSAMQLPGSPPKMENGMAVSTDPKTGQPIQQVPANPQARAKFEDALQRLAIKINELKQEGGTVEQDGSIAQNALNTAAATNLSLPIPGTDGERIDLPGGQTIARISGSKAQGTRDEIQSIVNQEMLPYMQAVGATPGMERAFGSQMAMLKALGGNTYMQRDTMLNNLAALSSQAGTGEFAQLRSPDLYNPANRQQQLQQAVTGSIPAQQPSGKTITMQQVKDAAQKYGKTPQQVIQDAQSKGYSIAQ